MTEGLVNQPHCGTNFENGGKRLRQDLDFSLNMTWGWDIPLPAKFEPCKYPKSGGNKSRHKVHTVKQRRQVCARDAAAERKHSVKCNVVTFGPVNGKIVGIIPERNQYYKHQDVDDEGEEEGAYLTPQNGGSDSSSNGSNKQNVFSKNQLLVQLHQRSTSLMKYLQKRYGPSSDKILKLTVDDISVPIARRPRRQYKDVVKPPSNINTPETMQSPLVSLLNNNNIPSSANKIIGDSIGVLAQKILEFPTPMPSFHPRILVPVNMKPQQQSVFGERRYFIEEEDNKEKDKAYIKTLSQLTGMLSVETSRDDSINRWLNTASSWNEA